MSDLVPRVRLALVGCGAIAQQMYLPVLAGHEGIELVALVDRDKDRVEKLAKAFKVPEIYVDIADIPTGHIDAAILATPPAHHAPGTIALLEKGMHVLVEKPMATCLADAQAMCQAADSANRTLVVGFFRRFFPSIRLMKGLLDAETWGRPRRFSAEGGGIYSWSAATLGNMLRPLAGGGVLIDYGSHLLDLLFMLFEGPAELLHYADNCLGGIEADCQLTLRLRHAGEPVEGTVELARTRYLGNSIEVHCEKAILRFSFLERFGIQILPKQNYTHDTITGQERNYHLSAKWTDQEEEESWYETFRWQIDDWLDAIHKKHRPFCDARSSLATMELIEQCYSRTGKLPEPWVWEGVARRWDSNEIKVATSVQSTALVGVVPPAGGNSRRKVLVTGASGFIGTRVAEVLQLDGQWEVRAVVHNPGNAARLARLPVEMVQADLRDKSHALALVRDCDAVVHCAIGTEWGRRREIFAVTVGGTQNLLQAASRANVKRFVHLSTISVYGDELILTGTIEESCPLNPVRGSEYGESKLAAERAVTRAARRGLEAIILRPARVYGPFSRIFIDRPLRAIACGGFRWLSNPDVPADMVYVDNVVAAILAALSAPSSAARGEAYNVGEESAVTWREFYGYFAERFGLELPQDVFLDRSSRTRSVKWYSPAAWARGLREVVTSPEFKRLGRRVLDTPPIGSLPSWAIQNFPAVEKFARRLVGADDTPPVYYRRAPVRQLTQVEMGSAGAVVSITKARRLLGYNPSVSLERGLDLTAQWVEYARLLDKRNL